MKIQKCDCEFREIPGAGVDGVKGYTLATECAPCAINRSKRGKQQSDAVVALAAREEKKQSLIDSGAKKLKELGFTDEEIMAFLVGVPS